MSYDLVKRLRDLGDHASFEPHMHHTAADRIKELEAKLAIYEDALKHIAQHDTQMRAIKALSDANGGKDGC